MPDPGADFSQVDQLAADLGEVPRNIGPLINSAVQVTSVKVKKRAARTAGRRKGLGVAAQAIDYEVKTFQGFGASVIQSEIGYDKDKTAGALGNLIEFGAPDSLNGPLTPTSDLSRALHEEEHDFVIGLDKATEDAERKAGL